MKFYLFWKKIIPLVAFNLFCSPILAQINFSDGIQNSLKSQLYSLKFPEKSPNRKSPEKTASGGVRGECELLGRGQSADQFLVSLMSNRKEIKIPRAHHSEITKTVHPRPSFWFYIPENIVQDAYFRLDYKKKNIFIQRIKLSELPGSKDSGKEPGIIEIGLPEDVNLEINKEYDWKLSLLCEEQNDEGLNRKFENTVKGKIKRVELDSNIQSQIDQTQDSLEKARIYAENELWYETLNILIDFRESNPQEWREFLESVGLQDYSDKPFLDCCLWQE